MNDIKRILVVDDEESNRSLFEAMLESFGYEAELATEGTEALQKLNSSIDLVLLDVRMPGLDGLEVARRIRSRADCGDIPIVIVTAFSGKEERLQAAAAGANDFISKPIDKTALQVRLASLLKMKDAQDALRQSEEKYRTLVETMKDVIWTVDLDLRYTYVSPSVTDALGYRVEEIMSMHPLDGLTPESREKILRAFQEELALEAEGLRGRYASRTEEIGRRHKDGSTRWAEVTATFLRDESGQPLGIMGTSRDITGRKEMEHALREAHDELEQRVKARTEELVRANEQLTQEVADRKKAERALREREEHYRGVFENAGVGIDALDPDGRIVQVNQALLDMLGYSREEIGRVTFLDVTHPDDKEISKQKLEELQEGRIDSYRIEKRYLRKDGSILWGDLSTTAVHDANGEHVGMVGVIADITDRKVAEQALIESEERYRALFENTGSGVVIYEAVDDGEDFVVASLNKAAEIIAGVQRDQVIGKRVSNVFPGVRKLGLLDVMQRTWKSGNPAHHPVSKYADGRIEIWVENFVYKLPSGEIVAVFNDETQRKEAEESLRQSEEKYRLVVHKAQEAILVAQDELLRFVNPKAVELMLYAEEELVGRPFSEFLHPDDREMVLDRHRRRLRGERFPTRYSFRIVDKKGAVKWVEIDSGLITWEQSPAALVFMSDVTERTHKETALKESEEWYRNIVEESFDGILVHRGSRIVFANRHLHEMLGYSPGELDGLDHWLLYHPDHQDMVRERAEARMRGEERPRQYEVLFQRKDGSHFQGEINAKMIDVKGDPGVQVWVRDISQRKRSEEAQRRLATAVEQAAEAVVITDVSGNIQYVNPAFERISGYEREEIGGQNPRLLKSGEHGQEFYRDLWKTITRGEVWKGRIINKKKDGSLYHEESTITPVRDSSGKIVNFVAVKRDITEHLQLSQQLLQAQKMEAIGTLAGGIAHDFNNLLQVTLGYSELLMQEINEGSRGYADLQKIFQAATSGAELVQRLLTFSRKVESKPIPLNLNRQIVQVERLLRRTIPKMIEIQLDLSGPLAEVNADSTHVEQILMNLAVNARDAMPNGGRLTIVTKNVALDEAYCRVNVGAKLGEYVMVSVSDTGLGMTEETIEHIFEPFYTTKELGKGTGLGLAMVYGIVKQHGGYITCSSEVGKGTTFSLYFPALPTIEEPSVDASGPMPAFGTETVLVVDDEEFVREISERILTRSGYTVLTAAGGQEALELYGLERDRIGLVVLDLIMPTMGGKDCLRELLKVNPGAKVLIASGYSWDAATQECIDLGAKGFVPKPFKFKELLRRVRKALDES